ncbi:PTS mannose transporter subunit IIAB [Blochmannia endosymbiont of Colobopsis nipponica]|uniref:PTS mannose transporter subunit IIAB n=1 Tax=Blochmannia endosymbiont of Colobopsis nipponica TaxID=2681987 RepID=UPI00177E2E74|nr:PTS mannose transporter subunit IIAB [Blochmannia endosymbiont of Colobopsis nipponica]QOI11013.1 PTS mannose transporter subunit IIAB [Blochmannia endosymbiont of Colobopsis nipponica]
MSIAIIVSTHGSTSEFLLKTTEMILGTQDNTSWVNFLPEENTKILREKFSQSLSKLNITVGVLFFVDIWGGTPFNVANDFINDKENYDIISGVNVPMLIETFMARNDKNIIFKELINIAITKGRDSIRSAKNNISGISSFNKIKDIKNVSQNENHHMLISLVRIDDRLIHGQVVTSWTKETNVSRIIVVNDEIAKDKIRTTLLTQVAPPGISVHVINIAKTIRVFNNPRYDKEKVMLLLNNPNDVLRLIEGGIPITSVNIGGMAFHTGKIQIHNVISVNEEDIEAFKKLDKYGINLEIRKVVSDPPLKIMDLINKMNKSNFQEK